MRRAWGVASAAFQVRVMRVQRELDMWARRNVSGIFTFVLLAALASGEATALGGKDIASANCALCHNLAGPAPSTFKGVLNRKAPDLFYAGSKFKRAWLVEWIQHPTSIRPSGVMFLNNIATANGEDRIRADHFSTCASSLTVGEAEAVADYLMTLQDPTMLTGVVDTTKKMRRSKAVRLFSKSYACVGCHQIKVGKRIRGGFTGPDLRTAGNRLNPDWVYARIDNPQYWDPMTWMPRFTMSHGKRELLTLFIGSQASQE